MLPTQLNQVIRISGLAEVLDNYSLSATLTDASDQFVYANPAFTALYGWQEREIIGLKSLLLVADGFSGTKLSDIRRRITESTTVRVDNIPHKRKDGTELLVSLETYQMRWSHDHPATMVLGICSTGAASGDAGTKLLCDLLRFTHSVSRRNLPETQSLTRAQQISLLQEYGYSTKQVAAIMGLHPNTPHVILHRKRRKLAKLDGSPRPGSK